MFGRRYRVKRHTTLPKPLPVVKENLLVVICRLNEAKVVLERGDKSKQSLGVGGIAVEDPNGHCALQAGALHFVDGELHLEDKHE